MLERVIAEYGSCDFSCILVKQFNTDADYAEGVVLEILLDYCNLYELKLTTVYNLKGIYVCDGMHVWLCVCVQGAGVGGGGGWG